MLLFKKSLQSWKNAVSLHSQNDGAVAQMVEQWTENPCVGSSILPSTTLKWPSKYLEGHFCISVIPILFPPETLNRVLGKL